MFESRDRIVMVMELATRGELYDYLQERRRLPEEEARSIFRQITAAVHYCHQVAHTLAQHEQNLRYDTWPLYVRITM